MERNHCLVFLYASDKKSKDSLDCTVTPLPMHPERNKQIIENSIGTDMFHITGVKNTLVNPEFLHKMETAVQILVQELYE